MIVYPSTGRKFLQIDVETGGREGEEERKRNGWGGKERKKRGRTKECNNRKGVYVFQMSKRPRQRASASNYPWILVKMEDRCFYVGASSALSLRALKKHLTPFKTLSRLSSAPLNSGGPELSKIRRKPFPLLPILDTFLPFFFLTIGTTYYKGGEGED